jgi:hypothetical protein
MWLLIAAAFALAALALGVTKGGQAVIAQTAAAVVGRKHGPRWDRLHPDLRAAVEQVEQLATSSGLDVMFWDGWRDPEVEKADIARGVSHLKDPLNSLHPWGLAADIVFKNAVGAPTWLEDAAQPKGWIDPRWRQLAAIMEQVGLKSGGLMWGWDWPHAQLAGYTAASVRGEWGDNYLAFIQSTTGEAVA